MAVATVILLVAGLFVVAERPGPFGASDPVPGAGPALESAPSGQEDEPRPGGGTPSPADPSSFESTPIARASGAARSIELDGSFAAGDVVVLDGNLQMVRRTNIEVGAATFENGTLEIRGPARFEGRELALESDRFVVTPAEVKVFGDEIEENVFFAESSDAHLRHTAGTRVTQGRVRYHAEDGSVHDLALPVTIPSDGTASLNGEARWQDPPGTLTVEASDRFSWAGGGAIEFDGQRYEHELLGVTVGGGGFATDLRRSDDSVTVEGHGDVVQIWAGGIPQIATEAWVNLHDPDMTIAAGSEDRFTWAPHNDGDYLMTMSRITATTPEGQWVELALDPMPPMFGGEPHEPVAGQSPGLQRDLGEDPFSGTFKGITAGLTLGLSLFVLPFESTSPLDSTIWPGGADKRDISIHVPSETPPGTYTVGLLVEGNFEPVPVDITVRVP